MIEEHEQQETRLQDLIELVERDDLPTNVFTIEDKDPMVILGKLNAVIAGLKDLNTTFIDTDARATEALAKSIEALEKAEEALAEVITAGGTKVKRNGAFLAELNIDPIESQLATNTTNIADIDEHIVNLVAQLEDAIIEIEANYNKNVEQDTAIEDISTEIENNTTDISNLQTTQGSHTTQLINLSNQMLNKVDTGNVNQVIGGFKYFDQLFANNKQPVATIETTATKGIKFGVGDLIIQWGTSGTAGSTGEKTITLPIAMTTTNYFVGGCSNSQTYNVNSYFKPKSTSQITIRTTSGENVNWVVIGY